MDIEKRNSILTMLGFLQQCWPGYLTVQHEVLLFVINHHVNVTTLPRPLLCRLETLQNTFPP